MLGLGWALGALLRQEWRVHLGPCAEAQMNTPLLGHVEAMLGLCWTYVGPMLAHAGQLGAMLKAMLAYVEPVLGQ